MKGMLTRTTSAAGVVNFPDHATTHQIDLDGIKRGDECADVAVRVVKAVERGDLLPEEVLGAAAAVASAPRTTATARQLVCQPSPVRAFPIRGPSLPVCQLPHSFSQLTEPPPAPRPQPAPGPSSPPATSPCGSPIAAARPTTCHRASPRTWAAARTASAGVSPFVPDIPHASTAYPPRRSGRRSARRTPTRRNPGVA